MAKRQSGGGLCQCPGIITVLKDGTPFVCGGCSKFGLFSGIDGGCTNGRFSHSGWENDICVSCNDFFKNKESWPADVLAQFQIDRGDSLSKGGRGAQSGWLDLGDEDALFRQTKFQIDCRSALNDSCARHKTNPDDCYRCTHQLHLHKRCGPASPDYEKMTADWCAEPPLETPRGSLGGFEHDTESQKSAIFPNIQSSGGGGKRKRKKTKRKRTKRRITKRRITKRRITKRRRTKRRITNK